MLKLLLMFRRAPEVSPEEFVRYWRDEHIPLVIQVPGIVRYTISPLPAPLDDRDPPFDGIAELYFESRRSLEVALSSPETAATGRDGRNFIERGSIVRLVVEEEEVQLGPSEAGLG